MKPFNSNTWWPLGENVLKCIYHGIIADDKPFSDCIIHNEDLLKQFKDSIALNICKTTGKLRDYEFVTNSKDVFLNNLTIINFAEEFLIVIMSAEIEKIIYSDIFKCYIVTVTGSEVEKKSYSAGVCVKKFTKQLNNTIITNGLKFDILNEKPKCLIVDRPVNNNDDY